MKRPVSAAIGLKAVNDTARPVRALWAQVGLLEEQPSMQALNYPPHFTFAIYDSIDANLLRSAAREAALAMAGPLSEPVEVVFDIGDCVLFPPVEVLEEYELLQN